MASSCGNSNKNETTDSDSIAIMDMVETVVAANTTYIDKDSIGAVYIGKPITELADSVPNLYTSNHDTCEVQVATTPSYR